MKIDQQISHYHIIEKIGEGGMGEVFKAFDTKLERNVALKVLRPEVLEDPQAKKLFTQEARAASKLNHQNITTIYEIDEWHGVIFISMEYVSGETLRDVVQNHHPDPIPIHECFNYATQISEALKEAHDNHIIHRDIKSENIMVSSKGQVKVMDFGLAKIESAVTSQIGAMSGTMAFMSPEQTQGETVDLRTDIWSFGVVLYELLTGELPFKGFYEQELLYSIQAEEPDYSKISTLDTKDVWQSILKKSLAKEKESRYPDINHLLDELLLLKEQSPATIVLESDQETPAPSIAVLPFADMSPQKDQEYFCDGIAEEIINSLAQIENLKVVARTSAFSFKGKDMDIRDIGQKLNVNHILEGSIRKAGNKLRTTAQLIHVSDGFHLWSGRFDHNLDDVFAIQDEISYTIADHLKLKLIKDDRTRVKKGYTESVDAYNHYLMGRYFIDKGSKSNILKSLQCFKKATETDADFAPGFSGMGLANYNLALLGSEKPSRFFPKAMECAEKALSIDDTLFEARTILGLYKMFYDWDWEGAENDLQCALLLNPNNSFAYSGYIMYYVATGKLEAALIAAKKYLDFDPRSLRANHMMGMALLRTGRYKEAIKHLKKVIQMEPGKALAHFLYGQAFIKDDQYDQGLAQIEKAAALEKDNPMAISAQGWAYGITGHTKKAQQVLVRLEEMARDRYISEFLFAKIYAGMGDKNKAFESLENAYQQHAMSLAAILTDETVENLRSDPRFKSLLKKINLEKYVTL